MEGPALPAGPQSWLRSSPAQPLGVNLGGHIVLTPPGALLPRAPSPSVTHAASAAPTPPQLIPTKGRFSEIAPPPGLIRSRRAQAHRPVLVFPAESGPHASLGEKKGAASSGTPEEAWNNLPP